jgi:hypothetical protein
MKSHKIPDYNAAWYSILFHVNITSKAKKITVDIITATSFLKICVEFLTTYRGSGYLHLRKNFQKP